jgi:hypothetical protein
VLAISSGSEKFKVEAVFSGRRSIRLRIIHVRYDWLKVVTNPCIIINYLTSGTRVEAV